MTALQPESLALVVLGIWMLGITRLQTTIAFYSLHTIWLGLLALVLGWEGHEVHLALAGLAFLLLKGMALPLYLSHTSEKLGCRRDEGLAIGPPVLMMLTLGGLATLMLVQPFQGLVPPTAEPGLALLLVGMLQMLTRRMAISQIIGFLILENGLFLYTISQPHSMPLIIDMGVLLEVLMWTMMAGVLTFRIKDSFEHIDVSALKELHE
ncbi:MAG TPA: hypothetical protein VGO93_07480 [Candidatus Xenobia bacterium]|jgi:hydrogenase-4 component E